MKGTTQIRNLEPGKGKWLTGASFLILQNVNTPEFKATIDEIFALKINDNSESTGEIWSAYKLSRSAANYPVSQNGDASSGEIVTGGDSRLSNSRSPSGQAGGDLGAFFPNPIVKQIMGLALPTERPKHGQVLTWNEEKQSLEWK